MSTRAIVTTGKRRGWRAERVALVLMLAAVITSRPSARADLARTPLPGGLAVVAVPWHGSRTTAHPVTHDGTIVLQAVASNGADGNPVPLSSGTWDPGDGSLPQVIDVSNSRDLELSWTYAGAVGTTYHATIAVTGADGVTCTDTFSVQVQPASLETQANMAIDRALWYNHKAMNLDASGAYTLGYWNDTETGASTSAAVQAFEVNGHRESGSASTDPYVDDVARGLRYLQLHLQRIGLTSLAGAGTPGPAVLFTHGDDLAPADTIAPGLQLTRDPSGLLYQQGSDEIKWLFGRCAASNPPTYGTFDDLFWANFWYALPTGGRYDYFSVPGQTVCLFDITTNQAYDLTFTKWSGYFASTAQANHWDQDYDGYDYSLGVYAPLTPPGGFAYSRSQYSGGIANVPDLQGHAGTPDDPGPDVNGNGYGLQTDGPSLVYVGGQIIEAFVASGTPAATAVVGTEAGRAYSDIVQDLIDTYSWGQTDPASLMPSAHSQNGNGGGWIYDWNENFDNIDSSSSGWWGVAARAAEIWHVTVPQWVKDLNLNAGIPQLQASDGRCGYRSADDIGFSWSTMTSTTACLIMLSADGQGRDSAPFAAAENWVAANYGNAFSQVPGAVEPIGSIYSMYNLTKAMRLARDASGHSAPIALLGGTVDWYGGLPFPDDPSDPHNGLAYNLILNQRSDGKLAPQNAPGVGDGLANSWGILILSPTLFGETASTTAATVTAGSGTKVYGQPDPALTPTFSGFLAADGISVVETARDSGENVGSYATHAVATGALLANYTVTTTSGALTITPATPVATATGGTFAYDAAPHAGTCSVVGVGTDELTGTISYSSGAAPTNAGTYAVNCDFAATGNYNAAVTATATITITPAGSTTAVSCTDATYTGSALQTCIATTTGAGGLAASDAVTYANNTNAGTATASASFAGDANHASSTGASTFAINPAASTTVVNCADATYTGSAITTCTATTTGAGGLTASDVVSYANNTNAGTATATASFAGDANHASSTGTSTFTINPAASTTVVNCADATYTGSAITTCTATTTGAGGLSAADVVSYTNNTNAGTATATASFAGDANHAASNGSATFAISPAASTTVVTCTDASYTGSALQTCTATTTGAGGLSASDAVSYANNTNAGTANATASFAGDANHASSTGTSTFTINPAASTTVVSCTNATYTGSALQTCAATTTGAGGLTASDAVSYANNTNAGTATATASFAGDTNHAASNGSATFAISPAAPTTVVTCTDATYTGSAITTCTATTTGAGGLTASDVVSYANNTNAGTATATASFAGDANHASSTGTSTFTINPAASTTVVTCTDATYTGSAITTCTATTTGAGGLSATDVVSYTNNTNAGTATATASFAGDSNHASSTGASTFAIAKANAICAVTGYSVPYDGAAHTATGSCLGIAGDGALPAATLNLTNTAHTAAGTYANDPWSFAGTGNYNAASGTVTDNISRATPVATATGGTFTYDGQPHGGTCAVTGVNNAALTGAISYSSGAAPTAAGSYTVSCDFAAGGNYGAAATSTAAITINRAPSTTVVTCPASVVYTGAAQPVCAAAVTGAGGLNAAVTPVTYANNTNVGTATVSATYAGDANHAGSTGTGTFAISQATSNNLPPIAVVDTFTTQWNTLLTIASPGVLGNDSDPEHSALSAILVSTTGHGTLVFSANGSFTYMPNQNYSGIDTFSYKVTDGLLASNTVVVTITIVSPCRAPADTVHYDGDQCDHERRINGHHTGDGCEHERYDLEIDAHRDGDRCDHDRKINGHHDGDGCDHDKHNRSLRNRDYEGDNDHDRSFNDYDCAAGVPIARNDAYSTHLNAALTIGAPGVRANDTGAASVSLLTTTSNGVLTLGADGSFVYRPATGFTGTDTFVYVARSSTGVAGPSATVTITVQAHWVGDGCDHDRGRTPHRSGDGCDHDKAIHGGS